MSSSTTAESSGKQEESMQQAPTAPPMGPPMGPPPTYNEAMSSSPYPPMPAPASSSATPYPVTEKSTMPLPIAVQPTAPYPIDDTPIPVPMATHPIGFSDNALSPESHHYSQNQPIVNQPLHSGGEEYVHPKTYVVLQDRRRGDSDDCSCTDWLTCCFFCVECCRCVMLCLECADACNK